MGHSFARDRVPRALLRAVAMADESGHCRAVFAGGILFAEAASLQTDVDVRRGEADQRRRLVVEPDRARLPLLDAAIAHRARLVGGPTRGMVQEIFGRLLSRRRNHRALFYLGPAASAARRGGAFFLFSARHRCDREILLLQFSFDRALFVSLRRCGIWAGGIPRSGETRTAPSPRPPRRPR